MIGKGAYGKVYSLRDSRTKRSIPRILKISPIHDPRRIVTFNREVLYLQELQALRWRSKKHHTNVWRPLVPRLFQKQVIRASSLSAPPPSISHMSKPSTPLTSTSASEQADGHQVMEQYKDNMTELGLRQCRNHVTDPKKEKTSVAFTTQQLCLMKELVFALDQFGIVHGDAKRHNLLYRVVWNRKTHKRLLEIVWSDFGFTGITAIQHQDSQQSVEGYFTQPKLGFPDLKPHIHPLPAHLWPFVNRWQMYFDMVYNRPTYWIQKNGKCVRLVHYLAAKMLQLPTTIVDQFHAVYRLYADNKQLPKDVRRYLIASGHIKSNTQPQQPK